LDEFSFIATDADESEIWDGSANVEQSDTNHNVYKGDIGNKEVGFGKWCATCHPYIHGANKSDPEVGDGESWIRHPTATLLSSDIINAYGGKSSYLYPLETASGDAVVTDTHTLVDGENGVTCLTCHKAHASEYPNALRWEYMPEQQLTPGVGCKKCHTPSE
jgi:predicted CXXCH cytochrome family protein